MAAGSWCASSTTMTAGVCGSSASAAVSRVRPGDRHSTGIWRFSAWNWVRVSVRSRVFPLPPGPVTITTIGQLPLRSSAELRAISSASRPTRGPRSLSTVLGSRRSPANVSRERKASSPGTLSNLLRTTTSQVASRTSASCAGEVVQELARPRWSSSSQFGYLTISSRASRDARPRTPGGVRPPRRCRPSPLPEHRLGSARPDACTASSPTHRR